MDVGRDRRSDHHSRCKETVRSAFDFQSRSVTARARRGLLRPTEPTLRRGIAEARVTGASGGVDIRSRPSGSLERIELAGGTRWQ